VLWWSLALGADLGGNATAIGASANVVIVGLTERAGRRISFWEFTRYGLVVTVVTGPAHHAPAAGDPARLPAACWYGRHARSTVRARCAGKPGRQ